MHCAIVITEGKRSERMAKIDVFWVSFLLKSVWVAKRKKAVIIWNNVLLRILHVIRPRLVSIRESSCTWGIPYLLRDTYALSIIQLAGVWNLCLFLTYLFWFCAMSSVYIYIGSKPTANTPNLVITQNWPPLSPPCECSGRHAFPSSSSVIWKGWKQRHDRVPLREPFTFGTDRPY